MILVAQAREVPVREVTIPRGHVQLAAKVWGDRGRPTFVLVHGYPDDSGVWSAIAGELARHYCVVTYDVRGAGKSSAPRSQRGYALTELVADLAAVIDATCTRPVHLVGHDWGSIASWEAVTDPDFAARRLASFTSISGPCLDHVAHHLRAHPLQALRQIARSWYMLAFELPFAPFVWKLVGPRWPAILSRLENVDAVASIDRTRDGMNGMALYRENVLARLRRPRTRTTKLPVQLVVPLRDRFVDPASLDAITRWVPRLTRREVVAGHWSVLLDRDVQLGALLAEWIEKF